MAIFSNQATLTVNGNSTNSNIAYGELLEVLAVTKTAVEGTYTPGELVTYVAHHNNGKACVRNETFTFKASGKRKYWRMQEMTNPCEDGNHADYVDVYF